MRLRVAHVVQCLHTGGLEQLVLELASRSRAFGIEPVVVSLTGDGIVGEALRRRGVRVETIDGLPGLSPRLLRALSGTLQRVGADVVHAHDRGAWLNALLALPRHARLFVTMHEVVRPGPAERVALAAASRFTSGIVACGRQVEAVLRETLPRSAPLRVIENGVPLGAPPPAEERAALRRELGLPADARVVAYLGRLHPEKGTDLLLEAFRRAFATDERTHLVLIGPGPMEEELRRTCAGEKRIHLLGDVAMGARLLGAADLYAQPSRREGRSLALLEAMAAGLATVTHDLPAIREVHEDGGTAILVPPGDVVELAAALARLLDAPAERKRLGEAARRRVAQWSIDAAVEAYAALYREAVPPLAAHA